MVQMDQKILDILEKIPKQILINCVSKMMVRKQKFPIIPGAIYEFDLKKPAPLNYLFKIPSHQILGEKKYLRWVVDLRAKLDHNSLGELDLILNSLGEDSSIGKKERKLNKKLYLEDDNGIYITDYKYSPDYLKLKEKKLQRLKTYIS